MKIKKWPHIQTLSVNSSLVLLRVALKLLYNTEQTPLHKKLVCKIADKGFPIDIS